MDVPLFQTGITTCSCLTVCRGYLKCEPLLTENIFPFVKYLDSVRTLEIDDGQFNSMFGYNPTWKTAVICWLGNTWALNYLLSALQSLTGYSVCLALIQPNRNSRTDKT